MKGETGYVLDGPAEGAASSGSQDAPVASRDASAWRPVRVSLPNTESTTRNARSSAKPAGRFKERRRFARASVRVHPAFLDGPITEGPPRHAVFARDYLSRRALASADVLVAIA